MLIFRNFTIFRIFFVTFYAIRRGQSNFLMGGYLHARNPRILTLKSRAFTPLTHSTTLHVPVRNMPCHEQIETETANYKMFSVFKKGIIGY